MPPSVADKSTHRVTLLALRCHEVPPVLPAGGLLCEIILDQIHQIHVEVCEIKLCLGIAVDVKMLDSYVYR